MRPHHLHSSQITHHQTFLCVRNFGYERSEESKKITMTDPIADMLTRIRNACGSKHRRVDMPASKMKIEITRILKQNNLIQDYSTLDSEEGHPLLRVRLKYAGGQPVIRELQRVSS